MNIPTLTPQRFRNRPLRVLRLGERRGLAMIETLIVTLTFFGTLLMSVEMGRVGFEMLALNHTIKAASHWGSLGVIDEGSDRASTIKDRARRIWSDKGLNPDRLTIDIRALSSDPNSTVMTDWGNAGRRGEFLIVEGTLNTSLGSFLGILSGTGNTHSIELKARGVTRNE